MGGFGLDYPPLVVLDKILALFDDGVEVIFVGVHLADGCLCPEPGILQESQQFDLLLRKVRMPKVSNQHYSGLVPLMPCLVLETIIKNIRLSLLLHPSLISNPHAAILDSSKGQMEPQFFIGGSVVFHDMRIGGECADESVVVVIGDVLIDHLHYEGYLLAVVVEFHVVQLEVEDVPRAAVDRLVSYPVFCLSLGNPGRAAIGLKSLLVSQGQQLVTYLLIVILEML